MKLFEFLKAKPRTDASGTKGRILSTKTVANGMKVVHRETIIKRERSPADQAKVDAMVAFIDKVLANEDIDSVFLAVFYEAKSLEYKLLADPENLLHKLNNVR